MRRERIFLMGICLALMGSIAFFTAYFSESPQPLYQLSEVQKDGFYAIGAIFIAMCFICIAGIKGKQ